LSFGWSQARYSVLRDHARGHGPHAPLRPVGARGRGALSRYAGAPSEDVGHWARRRPASVDKQVGRAWCGRPKAIACGPPPHPGEVRCHPVTTSPRTGRGASGAARTAAARGGVLGGRRGCARFPRRDSRPEAASPPTDGRPGTR